MQGRFGGADRRDAAVREGADGARQCYVVEAYTAGHQPSMLLAHNDGTLRTWPTMEQAVQDAQCAVDNDVRTLRGIHARLAVYFERPTNDNGLVARIMNDGILVKRFTVYRWALAVPGAVPGAAQPVVLP